jgi:hypothetical protein
MNKLGWTLKSLVTGQPVRIGDDFIGPTGEIVRLEDGYPPLQGFSGGSPGRAAVRMVTGPHKAMGVVEYAPSAILCQWVPKNVTVDPMTDDAFLRARVFWQRGAPSWAPD